jgi:hypothetical protein
VVDRYLDSNNTRRIIFYNNGNIKQILFIKKEIINGVVYSYYPNGLLRSKHEMIKDSIAIGSSWEYFKTGQIHKYRFYNNQGNLIYLRVYDIFGNVIKEEGSVLGNIIEKDTIIEGKTKLVIHPQLIHPPFCSTFLSSVKILDKSKEINILTTATKDTTLYIDYSSSPFEIEVIANLIDTLHNKTHKTVLNLEIKEHN